MVARRKDGLSIDLPKLLPETPQEHAWYTQSESNK
jgi:hypothetical protein